MVVVDGAFALSNNLMKPLPDKHLKGSIERAYNYRHLWARRVIENAFGILFRVLQKLVALEPEKARWIVLSYAYLHNFLRNCKNSRNTYSPASSFDGEDTEGNIIPGDCRL
jgi:hypothetical protein